jgi:hypothetical protein
MQIADYPDWGPAMLKSIAELLNASTLPVATPGTVALGMAAIAGVLLLTLALRGRTGQDRLAAGFVATEARLQSTELLLAAATSELCVLRQRVEQLGARQDAASAGRSGDTLRQAIALSRHGASTRQIIDSCGLSQGEAHLIQTLYGRPAEGSGPEELH